MKDHPADGEEVHTRMLRLTPALEDRGDLPQAVLQVCSGPRRGWRYALDLGRTTIGRASDATIRVDGVGVSRWHSELRIDPEGAVLLGDAGSTNGTWLNGADLGGEVRRLRDGDLIGVGEIQLQLHLR